MTDNIVNIDGTPVTEEKQETLIEGPSLYDMNKQMIEKQGKMSLYAIDEAKKLLQKFFRSTKNVNEPKYFMLLCRELSDYTLFRLDWERAAGSKMDTKHYVERQSADDVIDCMRNRGDIYSINWDNANHSAIEIWIKYFNNSEMYAYYLFPYDNGVIEEY